MSTPYHQLQYRVLYADTDAGGIVYNGTYLRFFEMGRTEMMRRQVSSYKDVANRGIILPVTESYLRYKAPIFYDDLITIETKLIEVKKVSCKFSYRITRIEDETDRVKLLTKGHTIHAAVNLKGKLTPFPQDLLEKMEILLQHQG